MTTSTQHEDDQELCMRLIDDLISARRRATGSEHARLDAVTRTIERAITTAVVDPGSSVVRFVPDALADAAATARRMPARTRTVLGAACARARLDCLSRPTDSRASRDLTVGLTLAERLDDRPTLVLRVDGRGTVTRAPLQD